MARYLVTAFYKDGTMKTKKLNLPANYERAECEVECYLDMNNIKDFDLTRL